MEGWLGSLYHTHVVSQSTWHILFAKPCLDSVGKPGIQGWIGFSPKGILMFCLYCPTEKEGGYWKWQTTNWGHFKRRHWHTWWSQPSCRWNQLSHRREYLVKPKVKRKVIMTQALINGNQWEISVVKANTVIFLWV